MGFKGERAKILHHPACIQQCSNGFMKLSLLLANFHVQSLAGHHKIIAAHNSRWKPQSQQQIDLREVRKRRVRVGSALLVDVKRIYFKSRPSFKWRSFDFEIHRRHLDCVFAIFGDACLLRTLIWIIVENCECYYCVTWSLLIIPLQIAAKPNEAHYWAITVLSWCDISAIIKARGECQRMGLDQQFQQRRLCLPEGKQLWKFPRFWRIRL